MKNGFTLIELLVVVLIIGILAAVALPQYEVAVRKARILKLMPVGRSVKQAAEAYYMANGKYTYLLSDLDIGLKGSSESVDENGVSGVVFSNGDAIHLYGNYGGAPRVLMENKNFPEFFVLFYLDQSGYSGHKDKCYGIPGVGERICKSLGDGVLTGTVNKHNVYNMTR